VTGGDQQKIQEEQGTQTQGAEIEEGPVGEVGELNAIIQAMKKAASEL
jgi:hypothetical protein